MKSSWFVVVVAVVLSVASVAVAETEVQPDVRSVGERQPGAAFARAVTGAIDRGFELAAVDAVAVDDRYRLDVTVAKRRVARRFTLELDRDGERPVAFRARRVDRPAERRVYRFADDLLALVRGGAVTSLSAECGSFFAEGPAGGSAVDPFDYYVVERSARGRAAGRLVAQAIGDRLEDGVRLAALLPSGDVPAGAARALDLAFVKGGEDIVHVGVDHNGRIVAAEVRYSPAAYDAWAATYRNAGDLRRAVRAAGAVRALEFDGRDGGEPRLTLRLRGGKVFIIDATDFAADDDGDETIACGC